MKLSASIISSPYPNFKLLDQVIEKLLAKTIFKNLLF